jgi:hypothetical protein
VGAVEEDLMKDDEALLHLFINESTFTAQMLGSGVNLIGSANYGRKGDYFQAFTNLATGLERIGKLCVLIDFAIDHQGRCR